jgi:hypothetical protein
LFNKAPAKNEGVLSYRTNRARLWPAITQFFIEGYFGADSKVVEAAVQNAALVKV